MDMGSTGVAIVGIAFASMGAYQGDFIAALILGGLLAALSVKLAYKTALDLTDVVSPQLVTKIRRIANSTKGVVGTGSVLVRKSGDTVFADITVLLRGDTSFERAHEISDDVERNVCDQITNASVTTHFEPDWKGVPLDTRILEISASVKNVRNVHNVSTHRVNGKIYADLHVMVDKGISLLDAHAISEIVEKKVHQNISQIEHATIHLEPFVSVPRDLDTSSTEIKEKVKEILEGYEQVHGIGRIASLVFGNTFKIDIDCYFDGKLSIETVHDLTTQIEQVIRQQIKSAVIIIIHPEPSQSK